MPSKLSDESNLHFLYACLAKSDYSRIDFNSVAKTFGIQAPAARMRFARLKASLGEATKLRSREAALKRKKFTGVGAGMDYAMEGDCQATEQDDDEDIVLARQGRPQYCDGVEIKKEEDDVSQLWRFSPFEVDAPLMKTEGTEEDRQLPTLVPHGLPTQRQLPYWPPQPTKEG